MYVLPLIDTYPPLPMHLHLTGEATALFFPVKAKLSVITRRTVRCSSDEKQRRALRFTFAITLGPAACLRGTRVVSARDFCRSETRCFNAGAPLKGSEKVCFPCRFNREKPGGSENKRQTCTMGRFGCDGCAQPQY